MLTSAQAVGRPEPGSSVQVAGVVTHRQRPMTAQGVTFLNLEDETGLINVRQEPRDADPARAREGVVNIVADHLATASHPDDSHRPVRDFR